jgi:hypothetical protein
MSFQGAYPDIPRCSMALFLSFDQEILPTSRIYGGAGYTSRSANSVHDQSALRNFSISPRQ